jgi:deoxyribose-phosphate aldolase
VERHCAEAVEHGFRAVCLYPAHLAAAARALEGSRVLIAGVVAFPHGASTLLGKVFEGLEAYKHGAAELDIVLDLGAIASGDRDRIEEEVRTLMARVPECRHKLIVETGMFTHDQLAPVLKILNQRRPAYVKTSTGVNARGATPEDVAFLRKALHRSIGIKAAGGIRTVAQVEALVAAGATCIGTSAGVDLMRQV